MDKHVHEYKHKKEFAYGQNNEWLLCACGAQMTLQMTLEMVNATERLSAEVANRIHFSDYDDELDSNIDEDYLALKAYADTLDG